MEQLSEQLRQQREDRSVSIETIAQITKVAPRRLHALESGDYAELPGGIFRKGILRGYLAAIGLDEHDEHHWVERFERRLQELHLTEAPATEPVTHLDPKLEVFAENIRANRPETPARSLSDLRWYGVLLLAVILVAFGWCVWNYALRGHLLL